MTMAIPRVGPLLLVCLMISAAPALADERPNIVLVMADDQGWGEAGYMGHPVLKTPHLDAMADNGLRFNRFYAAAPVCSPTRASVLTGRTNLRCGVDTHGYALRLQERTLAAALQAAGYATGHFGKWHLNGLRGPGVPVLASDTHHPGKFGFDHWLSVTNFFDRDPILSRNGAFEEHRGDSSEIVVEQATRFMAEQAKQGKPFLAVIWYGTPHSPFRAAPEDTEPFGDLSNASANHYGELVAMDRSIGALRAGLRQMQEADNTLLWFCSDNGGLPKISPSTTGGLRGFKGSLYEGGLRVPAIIEWPAKAPKARVTEHPASTVDIFPTIAEIVGLPADAMLQPQDGMSLAPLLARDGLRPRPLMFRTFKTSAMVDNQWKLMAFAQPARKKAGPVTGKRPDVGGRRWELYDLAADPQEQKNVIHVHPQKFAAMKQQLEAWEASVERSIQGLDYPEGRLLPENPQPRFWMTEEAYRPYLDEWRSRPEYASRLKQKRPAKAPKRRRRPPR